MRGGSLMGQFSKCFWICFGAAPFSLATLSPPVLDGSFFGRVIMVQQKDQRERETETYTGRDRERGGVAFPFQPPLLSLFLSLLVRVVVVVVVVGVCLPNNSKGFTLQ